ncbi:MAG: acyl-CoA dehydrogenase [Bacteriovoracaceae bacterium]
MAKYITDVKDVFFNLFEYLKIQEHSGEVGEDELKDVIREFDKFVENEIYPARIPGDIEGVIMEDKQVKVTQSYHKALKAYYENGWFALAMEEDVGGMPAPMSVYFLVNSLGTGANTAFMMYPGLSKAALNLLLAKGTPEQKEILTGPMMEGRWGGTMCLTEPEAGSDVGNCTTMAKPIEDGKYNINGVKIFISGGDNDLYENIIHLVLARTPGAPEGVKGLSLFMVSKYKLNSDGSLGDANDVICTKIEEKMGIHGSATCELSFGENNNCEGTLVGNEFEGIQNMFLMMNEARLICGIQGESQANLAYELTKQYAEERSQFGKNLCGHPDTKRMLLKMRSMSRAMRALSLYTGDLFDKAKNDPKVEEEIALLTPVCKAYCSDRGFDVSVDAVQVHGGYGYCTEYAIEQFVRDSKIATIYEGTNGIQAIDFVMRKILKDNGEAFKNLATKITKTLSNPLAGTWSHQVGQIAKILQSGQGILEKFGKNAQSKEFDKVLLCSTDFLRFCGNVICAWLLLDQAIQAHSKIDNADAESKQYYQSKVDDFVVFCRHYLSENDGLASSILEGEGQELEMKI